MKYKLITLNKPFVNEWVVNKLKFFYGKEFDYFYCFRVAINYKSLKVETFNSIKDLYEYCIENKIVYFKQSKTIKQLDISLYHEHGFRIGFVDNKTFKEIKNYLMSDF